MRRAVFIVLAALLIPTAAFCQSNSSESQTLQQLLSEVRALRQELRTSLTKVQKAQILISRVQVQETVVEHASQHLDELRSKLTDAQANSRHASDNLSRLQADFDADPDHQKDMQGALDHLKAQLESSTADEEQRQTAETEAERQLRTERDKLDSLQAQLDEIVKELDTVGPQSGSVAH